MAYAAYAAQREDYDVDPVKFSVLRQLWEASQEADERAWSLAKLSKRSGIPMSTLRRTLTEFEMAGIVDVVEKEDGRSFATLNDEGMEVFPSLFNMQ
ncbi:MAG TPA: helix-turn-helix domain-containing protein [Rhodocyclaceae bacterium]|jgi:Fe2+ or Zn2+ uptake regulation protein|nr:helix-turn-helix domain-containing protein [Rhodocyclaceae bacterium]